MCILIHDGPPAHRDLRESRCGEPAIQHRQLFGAQPIRFGKVSVELDGQLFQHRRIHPGRRSIASLEVAPEPGQPVVEFDGGRDLVRGTLIADLIEFGLHRAAQPRDRGDAEKPRQTPGLWRPPPHFLISLCCF